MARPIDADAVKFSISGLRYIDPNDYFALTEYFMKQVKAMPTLTPLNEWVNRDECLPEWQADVLVRYANGKIDISWVDSVGAFQFEILYGRVTHWMPLPAPPDRRPPEGEA